MLSFVAFQTTYLGKSSAHCQCVRANKEGEMMQFTYRVSWCPLKKGSATDEGSSALPQALEVQTEGFSLSPSVLLTAEATIWHQVGFDLRLRL